MKTGDIVNLARRVIEALGLDMTTGFQRIEYDDVFPGSDWAVPSGASAPDSVTVTTGGVSFVRRAFDGGTLTETMSNSWEIVHGIAVDALNAGTLKPEVHVHSAASTTGSGVVVWQVAMLHTKPGAAPVSLGTIRIPCTYSANQQYWHKICGVEFNAPTAGFDIGDIIEFNVFRDPTDSEDTYTGDALLSQCALHMPMNSRGSRTRYTK